MRIQVSICNHNFQKFKKLQKKTWKTWKKNIFLVFLCFSSKIFHKNSFTICVFYYDCQLYQIPIFLFSSFYHTTPKKITKIWKIWKNFNVFFKIMVGTFCATCTVTGNPCFIMQNATFRPVKNILSTRKFQKDWMQYPILSEPSGAYVIEKKIFPIFWYFDFFWCAKRKKTPIYAIL